MLSRINSAETYSTIKNEVVAKILYDRGGGDPKNVLSHVTAGTLIWPEKIWRNLPSMLA